MNLSYSSLNRINSLPALVENGFYIGVDVGTGLARLCIIDGNGTILLIAERPIIRQELKPDYITQSSTEIWAAICFTVRAVVKDSGIDPSLIYGIGFDATCSLTVVDEAANPLAVGPDFSNANQNIILWMDHRAVTETQEINATNYFGLKYVGGQMSIEMEIPKIKWLQGHMPDFKNAVFYDLPDFLVYKATGIAHRSYCLTVCKQGLVPPGVDGQTTGWSKEFFDQIGLSELTENDFKKLGGLPGGSGKWFSAGESVGPLSSTAAEELGLTTNCHVGSGVIDCYSGWIGTIAAKTDTRIPELDAQDAECVGIDRAVGRLAAVAGTSTCHCVMSKDPVFVPGVWGPYRDIMAPDYWLAEGGQSCTGALLAHVLATHPAYGELLSKADASGILKFDYLNLVLEGLKVERKARSVVSLAKYLFLYGDYHGNRSPIADPRMRASIIGQLMDSSLQDLAVTYLAACEFIAQQTRQIVEAMEKAGHKISSVFMLGGQCRNGLLMRLLADCVGKPIVIPQGQLISSAVVFGLAILGAVAAESVPKLLKRSNSIKFLQGAHTTSKYADLPSPYTAPAATALSSNVAALALMAAAAEYPFPTMPAPMTPMEEEKELEIADAPADAKPIDLDSEEESIHFGAQNKNFERVFHDKLKIRSRKGSVVKQRAGDKLWKVMERMSAVGKVIMPAPEGDPDRKLLDVKYGIFLDMAKTQIEYRNRVDKLE